MVGVPFDQWLSQSQRHYMTHWVDHQIKGGGIGRRPNRVLVGDLGG
jgi:hypothetical protein